MRKSHWNVSPAIRTITAIAGVLGLTAWSALSVFGQAALPDQVVEATSASGAAVSWTTPADYNCSPASGAVFALGTTAVNCVNATDASLSFAFNVTVRDTTPPALSLPADQVLTVTSGSTAVATYAAAASDLVSGPVAVACTPASGSTFSTGTTTVSCSASDAAGNVANGSFAITVDSSNQIVHLIAAAFDKSVTLPNGSDVSVPMWGFASDSNANGVLDGAEAPSVPGPRIDLPAGTTSLRVRLTNALPAGTGEPVSILVLGQPFDATPTMRQDGQGRQRVFSMTPDVQPGSSREYTFDNLKPGTFLYQSGSHQAVQVQMGLYGALTMDAAAGQAYPGVAYTHEVLLLHSEIDIPLHEAVADGRFGTSSGPTSTIDYKPSLFLLNGESFPSNALTLDNAGVAGESTLIRLLNAGLITHVPLLQNSSIAIVADDGNPMPYSYSQAAILLAAGKTHDVLWTPAAGGTFTLYDRAMSLSAAGYGDAGMIARLKVGAGSSSPSGSLAASDDSYAMTEDTTLAVPSAGVLGNDTGASSAQLLAGARAGSVNLNPDGSFTYTPNANFSGVDMFTYVASSGTASSAPATVVITVQPAADAPVANAIEVGVDAKAAVNVTLSGNDPDGDPLTFYLTGLPQHGTVSIIDAALMGAERPLTAADLRTAPGTGTAIPSNMVIYTPAASYASGPDSFTFVATDASSASNAAPVNATVHPVATASACAGATCVPLNISVWGRDPRNPSAAPTPIADFKWTLEEDRTYRVQPGVADPNTISVDFHSSYMPVVQSGETVGNVPSTAPMVDPTKRYFVSVLPTTLPYTNGGAQVAAGQTSANVTVNMGPQPTSQIRVRVFHDTLPLNGMWDSTESGLEGFEVSIDDAGGRYGISGGHQIMDAFGNMLGTEYQPCSAPPCDGYEVANIGKGFVVTDQDGYALLKNLPPGKFTVKVRPPGSEKWVQTSTIEGTPGIDAWVKNNEPQFFAEFGPPGPHAEIGMVQATSGSGVLGRGAGPFSTISGRITNMRMSRPPDYTFYSGGAYDYTRPWVALNTGAVGAGELLWAQPTDEDGNFTISGVPSGSYRLVVFDSALDIIIATKVINVQAPTALALGNVPVFSWFSRLYHYVFEDTDEDGFRDAGEVGLSEQAINLRFRDGSVYQTSATDGSGFVPFEEVFPFFAWQIAEVDYLRFRATGVTVVVDDGGNTKVNNGWAQLVGAEADPEVLAPQPQPENGGQPFRTETGPVLLQGFQGFLGQTSVMLWGKAPYASVGAVVEEVNAAPFDDFPGPGDIDVDGDGQFDADVYHGGVSGIVHYSVTRAENDARWGTAEPWEPGIPRVRVQLWDENRSKLLNEVETDSWDDSKPTGCPGQPYVFLGQPKDCYDGLRNFNQVRPAVFDGGYAFYTLKEPFVDQNGALMPVANRAIERPLPPGRYVVKVVVPGGYQLVKEEDKNVDFGEEYIPQQFWLAGYPLGNAGGPADAPPGVTVEEYPLYAPFCVGSLHEVPPTLSLFPGVVNTTYGGHKRPLCDAKLIEVKGGMNAAANFFLFTEAPVAGHIIGFVLDDTANEFDPNAPNFGEKYAPPFMPIAIRDWTGREIARTFTDAYGVYNILVPSTFTANAPIPSGMAPNMLTACLNPPTMPAADGTQVPDPNHYKEYSHFCYTFQYMPGTTTYLDTPVLPTGAFTGNGTFPVDAELPELTPVIAQVTNLYVPSGLLGVSANQIGPYIVDRGAGGQNTNNGRLRTIEIRSAGSVDVPNPAYTGVGSIEPKTIARDHGFGPATTNGEVWVGGTRLQVLQWGDDLIRALVPPGASTGEVSVKRCFIPKGLAGNCSGDSRKSVLGVTLTVSNPTLHTLRPPRIVPAGRSIQAAIDDAATLPGDLVLVRPGTYEEMIVLSKPVRLQGWGAMNTRISVVQSPAENIQAWRDHVGNLLTSNQDLLLPGQQGILGQAPFQGTISATIGGEAAGMTVFGRDGLRWPAVPALNIPDGACVTLLLVTPYPANDAYCLQNENYGGTPNYRPNARIDGFSIGGASTAPGIMVNGNARYLEISNNRVANNYGFYAGGISIGHPGGALPLADEDANNRQVSIHHNVVIQNAGLDQGSGAGIVIGTGADGYEVRDNWVAGNFSAGLGAGISHIGRSTGGSIDGNAVVFNESFNQLLSTSGAGIFVGGRAATLGQLTPGSGNVTISNNLIQGNQSSSGDGGGISLLGVNGQDASQPLALRHSVEIYNNVLVNNVAALAGGGIALQDAAYVSIAHNTIAHNDSVATAGAAFASTQNESTAQPAGIVSRGHTPLLRSALGAGAAFSQPNMVNNIIWQNRSFRFGVVCASQADADAGLCGTSGNQVPGGAPYPRYGLIPHTSPYWDLGVLGAAANARLQPRFSVLTDTAGYAANNVNTAPAFVRSYFNGGRSSITIPESTTLEAPAAFDEGGNFIRPQFGPLSVQADDGSFFGNYHLNAGVAGRSLIAEYGSQASIPLVLRTDFDGQNRAPGGPHRGADQKPATVPPPVTPLPQQ